MQKNKLNIFPEMQKEDRDRLRADLLSNGYDATQPIYTYHGEILDGWNRFTVCNELGITPVIKCFTGSDSEALDFVMRTNKRRNLTSSQWACIAAEADDLINAISEAVEEVKREKMIANDNAKKEKTEVQLIVPLIKDTSKLVVAKVAQTFNTNRTYVTEAVKLKAKDPVKFEQVKSGIKTMTEVKKEVKKEEILQAREEKRIELETQPVKEIKGPYDLIIADPPWRYDVCKTENRAIENHYPTQTHETIGTHNPDSAENCILFLWATAPKLKEALYVMEQWGFKYKTNAIWDKEKIGMGYWFRGQHELLLVGTKGKVKAPESFDRVSSVFREARTKHSKKPQCVFEWIEKSFPFAKKLEMYCRNPRDGWAAWGNEL